MLINNKTRFVRTEKVFEFFLLNLSNHLSPWPKLVTDPPTLGINPIKIIFHNSDEIKLEFRDDESIILYYLTIVLLRSKLK